MKYLNPLTIEKIATPLGNPPAGFIYTYSKSDNKLYRKDSAGIETLIEGGGASLKYATLTVGATGCDHTTIQGALDAIGVDGGTIKLIDASYTITTGLLIKSSGVEIIGNANGTKILCNGATVTTLIKANTTALQRFSLRDVWLDQTNATVQGTAIDNSNISLCVYENVRILSFGTAILMNDTANNTFYNSFKDVKIAECNNGIDITSTNPVNDNLFENIRIALRAGGAGTGLKMNNAQGNNFTNLNVEPATGAGISGVVMTTANVFDNNFFNLYAENNNIGLSLDANTQRNNFYGGNVVASITTNLSNLGKKNQFYGVNIGGIQANKQASTEFIDTSNASEVAVDIKNNTSFAHVAGRLVKMFLLNVSDSSNTLEVGTAGTGLALQIQNTWATLRGSNYSTIGVSNDVVFSNHSYIRMNGATLQILTGIEGGVDGKRLTLRNVTVNALTLNHENILSSANNRILTPTGTDYVVTAGREVDLIWDLSDSRWVVLSHQASGGAGSSPAGSDTQVQYNNAGVFGASADYTFNNTTKTLALSGLDTGINLTAITTEPATPATGIGRLYAKAIATRVMPKWIGPSGIDYPVQSHLGFNNVRMWRGGNTVVATTFASTTGTIPYTGASPIAPTIPAPSVTNILTQTVRSLISTLATAGSLAYIRANQLSFWRGNGAGLGGFFVVHRFALSGTLQVGLRIFAGITDSVANPTNIDPLTSTTPGCVGLAVNANTGNWRLVNNITGTARTALDLGASFPVTGAGMMELVLYSKPNDTGISYRVTNLSTMATTTGTLTTNIPANTTFLNPVVWITNNATALAQTLDFISTYVETDY